MNFKVGELAIVVGCYADPQFIGRIMTLKKRHVTETGVAWEMEEDLGGYLGIAEQHLRPIRDQPGEDETLTWVPVPHKGMV